MRKITTALVSLLFLAGAGVPSFAQQSATGNWIAYMGNQKIGRRLNWHNEVQLRNYNAIGDLQQFLIRTGIGYNLSENNNNILLGYAYFYTENYLANGVDKKGSQEHRLFQQWITRQQFGRCFIQHRYRVEERFLPDEFKVRLRYSLGFNLPLNHRAMVARTVYLSAYNELFINTGRLAFDRDRLYAGLGYAINKHLRVEVGYLSQQLESTHRNQFNIVFFNNLPLCKD